MRANKHGGKPKVPGKPVYPQRRSPEEFKEMGADVVNIGKIRKKRSIWAIDDSGTADFTHGASEYLTLTAVTMLTHTDFAELFRNITLYDGEVKFNLLRLEHPDQCTTVMKRVGSSTAIIVCYPRFKDYAHPQDRRQFFLDSIQLLIDAILSMDDSELILVGIDENTYLVSSDYYALCSPRCLVYPIDSKASKLVQAADLSTSSLGHALLPRGKGSSRYFDEIRDRTINVHGKPGASTQQTPTGFNRDSIVSEGEDLNIADSGKTDETSANRNRSKRRGTSKDSSKRMKSGSDSKSSSTRTKTKAKTKPTKGAR